MKYILAFLASLAAIFVIFITIPRNDIKIERQPKGQALHVKSVSLAKGGFIVVMAVNPATNLTDDLHLINNPIYMPSGTYKNINVLLNDDTLIDVNKVAVFLYEDLGQDPGLFEIDPEKKSNSDMPFYFWNGKIARKVIDVY